MENKNIDAEIENIKNNINYLSENINTYRYNLLNKPLVIISTDDPNIKKAIFITEDMLPSILEAFSNAAKLNATIEYINQLKATLSTLEQEKLAINNSTSQK